MSRFPRQIPRNSHIKQLEFCQEVQGQVDKETGETCGYREMYRGGGEMHRVLEDTKGGAEKCTILILRHT